MAATTENHEDQRALGLLAAAIKSREIFVHDIEQASSESISAICDCLQEYTGFAAAEHGRPSEHYLSGSASPETAERFSEIEAMGFIAICQVMFEQAESHGFAEGMTAASGLTAMAILIHARQVARAPEVQKAIDSKTYEMGRMFDLAFRMKRENEEHAG